MINKRKSKQRIKLRLRRFRLQRKMFPPQSVNLRKGRDF